MPVKFDTSQAHDALHEAIEAHEEASAAKQKEREEKLKARRRGEGH